MLAFLLSLNVDGLSNYSVGLANRYMEYVLVSYCIGMGGKGVPNWQCPACIEYFPNVKNVTVFSTDPQNYSTHAFVAYEPTMPEIIIAFTGTEPLSIQDWIDDLTFEKIPYPLSNQCNCQVHKGFYESYAVIKDQIWSTVKKYLNSFGKNIPIHITGHSLGSALATHCALDGILNHNISKYDYVYSYGPPRVGDKQFATFYVKNIATHFRITHHKDPVPQLPEQWMGFYHISREIYYENHPNTTYKICDGSGEDKHCRDKYGLELLHIEDHLDYMGFDLTTNDFKCKIK